MTTKEEENRFDKVEVLEGYHFFIIFSLSSIKSSYSATHNIFKFFSFKNVEVKQIEAPGGDKEVVEVLVTV